MNSIKRLSKTFASTSSRRSFFSTTGKWVAGLAGALAGGGFLSSQSAHAANGLNCCTGPRGCNTNGCPAGTSEKWSWTCSYQDRFYYICHDCYAGNTLSCIWVQRDV